ncbi:MAG TPA: DUF4260 domain-containing protein [Chloroflexota bacterium]
MTGITRILSSPTLLLRVEGGVLLALGLLLYWKIGGNWLAFVLLLLTPDISMAGYLAGPVVGAATYNLIHLYLLPSILAAVAILTGNTIILTLALIWFAHINMDRLLGYGLKLPSDFKDTHLGKMG